MPDRKTKRARKEPARKAGRSDPATGSYFLSLELENVRCFSERQTLDLSDGQGRPAQWTILLGENGTGKTTILQFLAGFAEMLGGSQAEKWRTRPIRFLFQPFYHLGTIFRDSGPQKALSTVRFHENCRMDPQHNGSVVSIRTEYSKQASSLDHSGHREKYPICYGYGVSRRLGISLDQSDLGDATEGLFLDHVGLIDAEDWLLRLDYSVSKPSEVREIQEQRLKMVKRVLMKVLPEISDIRFDPSSGIMPTPKVEFETPYGWVPLRQLGYGYRTMLAWVVDFTARMIDRYPDSSDPLAEPAVVLVDEIDLHLHPKWQREVIGFLTERFPNTQFIVTAHSPLVVQAAEGANIAVLRREWDHVVIDNDPETLRGWRVDQILTSGLFGLPTARPPDEEALILERKKLLEKSRLSRADRKRLEEINDRLGPIPSGESFDEARKTLDLIEKSLKLIEKYQDTKA